MPAFTTADAAERLASKQAAKQLGVSVGIGTGVKAKIKKPGIVQGAVKALGSVYDAAKNQPGAQLSTPVNTGSGVSMGGQQNAVQNVVEPIRAAGRRAVGDITAIPGVGKPSASPTAADFRAGNYVAPIVDYATLLSAAAPAVGKGVGAVRNRPPQVGYRTDHTKWWDVQQHATREIDELGNAFPDVSAYPNHEGIWVTHARDAARRYGDDIREVDLSGAKKIHQDSDGGFFYVRPKQPKLVPTKTKTTTAELARETQMNRRANEIVDELGLPLDEALVVAEVEMDFRDSALRMGLERFGLTGDNLRNYQNMVRNSSVDKIRASNPELDRMFLNMAEMAGFGE